MPEPLLRKVPSSEMPPAYRDRWAEAVRLRGEGTLLEVGANAPELIEWYYDRFYGEVFQHGRVDRRTKELARLKLSTLHGCAFCNRGNRVAALKAGVTADQIAALPDAADPIFSAADRAVLRLAEEKALQTMAGALDGPLYRDLHAHFDDGQIFELGMVMAILTGMAKFLFVFDLVTREADCPIGHTNPPAPPADRRDSS